MLPNVVEINGNDRYLRKERGFLSIVCKGESLGRLPLDDLDLVLITGHGTGVSSNLLEALAERCIPIIVCGRSMRPVSVTLPVEGHHLQSRRMALQVKARVPVQKRLWRQLVQTKITMQAMHLELSGKSGEKLRALARRVRSGDADNMEAVAASWYWTACFGKDFRRQRDEPTVNSLLNYAYAVLRAATARAVMLAGLHPAFGIFHHNSRNSMPLVDDMMEPFRPAADMMVCECLKQGGKEPDPESKRILAKLLHVDMACRGEIMPVARCLQAASVSLAAVYEGSAKELVLPDRLLPYGEGDEEENDGAVEQVQDYVDAGDV